MADTPAEQLVPPNPDNPNRAAVMGVGKDFVFKITPGAMANYLRQDGTWATPPGAGTLPWGAITGTLSNQVDLQNALNAKANSSAISVVGFSGQYADLLSKPTLGTVSPINLNGLTSQFLRGDGTWAVPVDVNATWGNITGTLSNQTDLQNALNLKAPLASPTFTGVPAAPTAAVSTNTTQLATTAYVINQLGSSAPLMDGTASSGSSLRITREDHRHPSDTTKLTNPMTTAGDIVIATTGGAPVRLAAGANGSLLRTASGAPAWLAPGTNGDMLSMVSGAPAWIAGGGRLIGVQKFTANGTYTPTAGTTSVIVDCYGAGGGGAGSNNPGAGNRTAGGAGGSGGWSRGRLTSGFSGAAVVVPSGGAGGGVGANGVNGGACTFGATLVVANGGAGGTSLGNIPDSIQLYSGAGAGAGPGTGNILAVSGNHAEGIFVAPNQGPHGSAGTVGFLGGGATLVGAGGSGANSDANSGAGGGGTAQAGNFAGVAGGNGGSGLCIVYEFAN